jgi:hypothetical protein
LDGGEHCGGGERSHGWTRGARAWRRLRLLNDEIILDGAFGARRIPLVDVASVDVDRIQYNVGFVFKVTFHLKSGTRVIARFQPPPGVDVTSSLAKLQRAMPR